MRKLLVFLCLGVFFATAFAKSINYSAYFKNKEGCFILYDLNSQKNVEEYNPSRCATQIAPDSTFKVALSLMAFDQNLITQKTIFKWDRKHRDLPIWNQNQTPHSWLQYSVVWVSQYLTPQVGMDKIVAYLKAFNYGNADFTGDPGKNNGLERAWLGSSLKISANEQIQFLSKLVKNTLPVSQTALNNTKTNMYLGTSSNGWKLYGKTGTHWTPNPENKRKILSQDGWFVGYLQRGSQTYIFAINYTDTQTPNRLEGGPYARQLTQNILTHLGIFDSRKKDHGTPILSTQKHTG